MESTANEMANVEWNRRLNMIKRNAHSGISIVDLGEDYYTRFLKISEVLIQLVLSIEGKLQGGRTCIFSDQVEHTLLELGGTMGLTVKYDVGGNSSAITIGDHFNPHVRIGMLRNDCTLEVLEGSSFVGQGMIVLQGTEYYSCTNTPNMESKVHESIQYLQNEKYRTFMIYGKHPEAPIDLISYEGIVQQLIERSINLGYIE
jgi:hypothetical protein